MADEEIDKEYPKGYAPALFVAYVKGAPEEREVIAKGMLQISEGYRELGVALREATEANKRLHAAIQANIGLD